MKIFVPGRICLFGEHSDWAGGYRRINADIEKGFTLITGTNQGIYAEIDPHPNALVLTSNDKSGRPAQITLPRGVIFGVTLQAQPTRSSHTITYEVWS